MVQEQVLKMSVARKLLLLILISSWYANTVAGEKAGKHLKKREAEMSHFSDRATYLSLDDVVNRVREQTGGRILSADEMDSEYRIRVLTGNGKVRRFRVDPATGDILRRRR